MLPSVFTHAHKSFVEGSHFSCVYVDIVAVSTASPLVDIRPLHNTMAGLAMLPFPPAELSWDKVAEVMDCLKLDKQQACTVMSLVLGQPSASGTPRQMLWFNRLPSMSTQRVVYS